MTGPVVGKKVPDVALHLTGPEAAFHSEVTAEIKMGLAPPPALSAVSAMVTGPLMISPLPHLSFLPLPKN